MTAIVAALEGAGRRSAFHIRAIMAIGLLGFFKHIQCPTHIPAPSASNLAFSEMRSLVDRFCPSVVDGDAHLSHDPHLCGYIAEGGNAVVQRSTTPAVTSVHFALLVNKSKYYRGTCSATKPNLLTLQKPTLLGCTQLAPNDASAFGQI
jgi:hypothetical protein